MDHTGFRKNVLRPSDVKTGMHFGSALDMLGDRLVVATIEEKVYQYRYDNGAWVDETIAILQPGDYWLEPVLGEDYLLIANWLEDCPGGADCGGIRYYAREGESWIEGPAMSVRHGQLNDRLGTSLQTDGRFIFANAPNYDCPTWEDCGAFYVFDLYSQDCNCDGTPDACQDDCNGNGIDDSCEIADGTSFDCNSNDIPDACEVLFDQVIDCNADGIPDSCQSLGEDCNQDGIADICGLPTLCETQLPGVYPASTFPYSDRYGSTSDMDDYVAVVGAPGRACADNEQALCGAAFVYRFDGQQWLLDTTLMASDAQPNALFGHDVSIDGDTILVGAPGMPCQAGFRLRRGIPIQMEWN